jgi:phage gp36-like protein
VRAGEAAGLISIAGLDDPPGVQAAHTRRAAFHVRRIARRGGTISPGAGSSMSYASQQQLVDRYGEKLLRQLTDRATPPAGAIDAAVVDRALADTDAVINGYLQGRYVLPLAQTPELLADTAQSIAIYKLHGTAVADKIKDDYAQALATLRMIALGTVRLEVAGIEPAANDASGVRTSDRPRDMTPGNLKGFI